MSRSAEHWDVVVIGGGPAGQAAAEAAVRHGARVAVVERDLGRGGANVHRGTIPGRTLGETAQRLSALRTCAGRHFDVAIAADTRLSSLMDRMEGVVAAHVADTRRRLENLGITLLHGRARFVDPHTVAVQAIYGEQRTLSADTIVVATGSQPTAPRQVAVDHEHVLDGDSILSLAYLPESIVVLGESVLAAEFASTFAVLGVGVTLVSREQSPLPFLDGELVAQFLEAFAQDPRCRFVGGATLEDVGWDGAEAVVTRLGDGTELRSEKALSALDREACVRGLGLEAAGLDLDADGFVAVDADQRTSVPHLFAVGDVAGTTPIASWAVVQGRRAIHAAMGLPSAAEWDATPVAVFTIPELATIGLDEHDATARFGRCLVGRTRLVDTTWGRLANVQGGMVKLVAEADSTRIVGCQIFGEGASELIHFAQQVMIHGGDARAFVGPAIHFPSRIEAFYLAALDLLAQVRDPAAVPAGA